MVGISGIGGLGNLSVKMAKALGCTVIALTNTEWKVSDSLRIGANDSILMSDDIKRHQYKNKLDIIIIDTIPTTYEATYHVDLLKANGIYHVLGDMNELPILKGRDSIWYNKTISGSNIGGIQDTIEMLDFCSKNNISADIVLINIKDVNYSLKLMVNSLVKYRFVIDLSTL